jgi:hypothetical protein
MADPFDPRLIPNHQKKKYLETFSEDEFRDRVVRPLYLMQGMTHGKDVCGPDEEGKDCYLWAADPIRKRALYAIQTKKGDLKQSSKLRDNVTAAEAQLRTALATFVHDAATKQKFQPACVVLVASGEINKAAREYITNQIPDPRIVFQDSDDLIPLIDQHMPEFWNGIDAKRLPYLKNLRAHLLAISTTIDVSEIGVASGSPSPITDEFFVQLYLHRYRSLPKRQQGKIEDTLDIEEIKIQDVLQRRENCILLTGDAGSGKTTALYRFGLILVEQALQSAKTIRIPVYLTSVDISKSDQSLAVLSGNATKNLTPDKAAAFDTADLTAGNVIVCVDGLDEVGDDTKRAAVFQKVIEFHRTYPECRVIIAARDYPFVDDLVSKHKTPRFRISPISFKQAEKMVVRLSRGHSLSQSETQETLRRLENIHGLQLNPLLVTVFVATSEYSRSDIPANITELFKKFTEVMLGRWGRTKGVAQQYHAPLKDFLLQQIAFQMHARQEVTISFADCKQIIEHELRERGHEADLEVLFDEIVFRSGLLRAQDGTLGFSHLLLQEFFAGRAIPSQEYLGRVVSNVWWTKAVVFYFGEHPGDSHGLVALREGIKGIIGADEFQAAVTVGLAAQACYLMKSVEKAEAMKWVVERLAECKDSALASLSEQLPEGYEVLPMLHYFLYGRDAVAGKIIRDVLQEIQKNIEGKMSQDDETKVFWCLAGMIESGQLAEAQRVLKQFAPQDVRLLLALQLGSMYVQHMHVTSDEQKKLATKICTDLEPRMGFLRAKVLKELKGILLEVQKGKVKALDGPANGDS